jgi:cell division protein FtsA
VQGLKEVVSNPTYATAVGLLLYGKAELDDTNKREEAKETSTALFKIKSWFKGNF